MSTVFAIGDSWFNYLFTDLSQVLVEQGFTIERVAVPGQTLQAIADGVLPAIAGVAQKSQLGELKALVFASATPPAAILLSAGGDDVVADDGIAGAKKKLPKRLKRLLNRAKSGAPPLIAAQVRDFVDRDLRNALATVLAAITSICRDRYPDRTIPIFIHGYAHPVADGRRGPFGQGPWLAPVFLEQGYGVEHMTSRRAAMRQLIDRLNAMQLQLIGKGRFPHVRHVDFRKVLSAKAGNYREHWENELHPTRQGFRLLGAKLAEELRQS